MDPSENSCSKYDLNVWSKTNVQHKKYDDKKGKQKMPEYELLDEESGNMEDVDSDVSLDEGLGTQALKTPDVGRAMKDAIQKLRSNREKQTVERYSYDTYIVMHYAYMSKVVQIPDPSTFEETILLRRNG